MKANEGLFLAHRAAGARAALLISLSKAGQNGWNAEQYFDHARGMGFDLTTSPEFARFVTQTVG